MSEAELYLKNPQHGNSSSGIAVVTGSNGLIGYSAVQMLLFNGFKVIGVDNGIRRLFFGEDINCHQGVAIQSQAFENYTHNAIDVQDLDSLKALFSEYSSDISLVIHAAGQPSHDWSAINPLADFHINASGTINMLEVFREYCPKAVLVYLSTNKVYGDRPNQLPFVEKNSRWEVDTSHN